MQHFYYPISKLSLSGTSGKIRDSVLTPGIVTITYDSHPHVHLLPLEMGLQLVRAKQIDLSKGSREIADMLDAQGFQKIAIHDGDALKNINLDSLANGAWRGYATQSQQPFGIYFPVKYDLSKL